MRYWIVFLILFLPMLIAAQTIPAARTHDWSAAGLDFGFPDSLPMINSAQFGVWADGVTDDHAAIQEAMDSLHGRQGIILLPAGDVFIGSTLLMPDSVILRGRGAGITRLLFDLQGLGGSAINISGGFTGAYIPLVLDAPRGDSILSLSATTGLSAGDLIEIRQENGTWDSQPASWAAYSDGQMARIAEVLSGDRIRIVSPLKLKLDTFYHAEIRRCLPASAIGVEKLSIIRKDSSTAASGYNIFISVATGCWVNGVESDHSIQSHIYLVQSAHVEISGSYIHHASAYDGSGTAGYGITLNKHTSECLIINNNFRILRHAMMVKTGANGNVFAYNRSVEPRRSEPIPDYSADISLHGHHPVANLFEGNDVQTIMIDHTYGPSGPFNTFFRNRANLYGFIITSATQVSDSQNVVGNEIMSIQLLQSFGFLPGPYALNGAGHFAYANNDRGSIKPPGATTLPEASLFLGAAPDFWIAGQPWPPIGYPLLPGTNAIPAATRYGLSQPTWYIEKVTGYPYRPKKRVV